MKGNYYSQFKCQNKDTVTEEAKKEQNLIVATMKVKHAQLDR